MTKDPHELYLRIDEAACALLDKDTSPFLVVLERSEFMEYASHPDGGRWFSVRPGGVLEICGLPVCQVRDRAHIPEGLVFSKVMAQVAFPGEYE